MHAVIIFASCVFHAVSGEADVGASIDQLKQSRYVGEERLSSIVTRIRGRDEWKGTALWEKLEPVVADQKAHFLVRSELLALACEKSDGATNDILALGEHWLAQIEAARNKADPADKRLTETESLLYRLVSNGYPHLRFDANTSARAFGLLRRAVLGIWAGENLEPCFRTLKQLPVSPESRRQLVVEAISSGKACSAFAPLPPSLLALVDEPAKV